MSTTTRTRHTTGRSAKAAAVGALATLAVLLTPNVAQAHTYYGWYSSKGACDAVGSASVAVGSWSTYECRPNWTYSSGYPKQNGWLLYGHCPNHRCY